MKNFKFASAVALAISLLAAGGAQATVELVKNGSFAANNGGGSATDWFDQGVQFGTGVARFGKDTDLMSQTFAGVVTGTSLALSFYFDNLKFNGNKTDDMLTVKLQRSLNPTFGGGATDTVGKITLHQNQTDGLYGFSVAGADVLGGGYYYRLYFNSKSDKNFSVDNVSLLATAPVPEPETYAMLLAGLGVVGFIARRRRPQA